MAEQCQEQKKELKALLRQVKAIGRELRRQLERARVQRRHVKQRQVSRARGRTHKLASCWYEEEFCGGRQIILNKQRSPFGEELYGLSEWEEAIYGVRERGNPWLDIDNQGWKMVATYSIKHWYSRSLNEGDDDDDEWMDISPRYGEGRFLAYNIYRRQALLSGYSSNGGCPTCGAWAIGSGEAMGDILEQASGVSTEKPFVAPAEEFLEYAQHLADPAMTLRRAMPEDVGYQSLVTLYAMYTLFHSRVLRRISGEHLWHKRQHADSALIARWSPRRWTATQYNAVVRLQAVWRGWHFRHRVLYSPHTELGRRYLLRAWQRECSEHNKKQQLMERYLNGCGRP